MEKITKKERISSRIYMKEFWPSMLSFVVVLVGAKILLAKYSDTIWEIPLALAPIIPIIFVTMSIVRFILRMDEYQKRLHMISAVYTLVLLTIAAFSYGFLEGLGFVHMDLIMAASMVCPFYFLIYVIVQRQA